jgi:hypothetical protein
MNTSVIIDCPEKTWHSEHGILGNCETHLGIIASELRVYATEYDIHFMTN